MSQLLIVPARGAFAKGQSFNFDIFSDGPELINAATIDIVWPAQRLQLTGTNFTGSALPGEAELTLESGHARISRFVLPKNNVVTPISGRQFLGTLIFAVLETGGASIKFTGSCEALRDGDAQNVLAQKFSGAYALSPTTRANLAESVQAVNDATAAIIGGQP